MPSYEVLALDRATGDAPHLAMDSSNAMPITPEESAAALVHVATTPITAMPAGLRARLVAASMPVRKAPMAHAPISNQPAPFTSARRTNLGWLAAAASLAALVAGGWYSWSRLQARERELLALRVELEQARGRIADNDRLLQAATAEAKALETRLAAHQSELQTERTKAQAAEAANLDAASRLAKATADLADAKLAIAAFEAPVDPALLQANRRKLLEMPGTVRLAWEPFDLPNQPAELRNIQGDVVWSDERQTGFLRFVGLKVNDPKVEQYQVWVIDERGMEQKVSGGVFNATAQGEVIVPIKPGIDVGRVALFAITIEKPGGTWVPDLTRRVVVAPRGT